ncbi:hypothetical protein C882_2720 [Caenispirillum salinarum AK4]|uniref:Glycine transporter domain-containing protein n=1 Tax=Caenispirillum salinarum AK4 TaxID=1238182 RepID=K9HWX6_9PROT|nr:trimeric intracellular cation channel family protein [Caenispirillum salinarum]EKV32641.1 hypothetical protein C882_2720 [Caenispirillum salinarum AK4]
MPPLSLLDIAGIVTVLDVLGVCVFAISGALVAARKEMDPIGFIALGTVTGIGGGTLRDLVLGVQPVFWVSDSLYLIAPVVVSLAMFWGARLFHSRYAGLVWADALGMALFSVTGASKALTLGAPPSVAIAMGIMTAAFGGIIRDVLAGESPLVLHKEIYVTAAFAGAGTLVILHGLGVGQEVRALAAFALAFTVRALAIARGWSLPHYRRPDRPLDGPPKRRD